MGRLERRLVAALTAAMLLASCSRATPENYAKVEVGMKKDQVHQIMGNPSKVDGVDLGPASLSVETWNNDPVVITITYDGDTVGMKSISGEDSKK